MNTKPPRLRPLALLVGCASPLARALAREAALRGVDLLLADSDGRRLMAARQALESTGVQISLFQGDPAEPAQRRELLRLLEQASAKPDLLLFLPSAELEDRRLSAEGGAVRHMLEARVPALDDLLRHGILASMQQEGNGYILAAAASRSFHRAAALRASQDAALAAYTEALGLELAGTGVSVTWAEGAERLLRADEGSWDEALAGEAKRVLRALFAGKQRVRLGGPNMGEWAQAIRTKAGAE